MASYLRVSHNGVTKTVALYDGIDQAELSSLFSTVFGVTGKIVGVMGEVSDPSFPLLLSSLASYPLLSSSPSEGTGCPPLAGLQGS